MDSDAGLFSVTARKVLIIEDDENVAHALADALTRAGMKTVCAVTGAEGLALQRSFAPDVVLVDLNLPDTDGLRLVTQLVERRECGVIILSGLSDEADRIVGLEIGADDYICKPPHVRELLARIRAVYRRATMRAAATVEPPVATTARLGTMTVDLRNRTVQSPDGARIALTSAEFVVLEIMLAANGEVVSRDCLSEAALRRPWRADDRSIDQLIFNLRHKLDADGQQLIHSVRGAGYMLCVTSPGPVRAADTPEGHADGNAGLSPMKIAAECP